MNKILNSFALLVGIICSGQNQFVFCENCMTHFSDDCLSKCVEILFGKMSCSICPLDIDFSIINTEVSKLVFSEKSSKKSESRLVELCSACQNGTLHENREVILQSNDNLKHLFNSLNMNWCINALKYLRNNVIQTFRMDDIPQDDMKSNRIRRFSAPYVHGHSANSQPSYPTSSNKQNWVVVGIVFFVILLIPVCGFFCKKFSDGLRSESELNT